MSHQWCPATGEFDGRVSGRGQTLTPLIPGPALGSGKATGHKRLLVCCCADTSHAYLIVLTSVTARVAMVCVIESVYFAGCARRANATVRRACCAVLITIAEAIIAFGSV